MRKYKLVNENGQDIYNDNEFVIVFLEVGQQAVFDRLGRGLFRTARVTEFTVGATTLVVRDYKNTYTFKEIGGKYNVTLQRV